MNKRTAPDGWTNEEIHERRSFFSQSNIHLLFNMNRLVSIQA